VIFLFSCLNDSIAIQTVEGETAPTTSKNSDKGLPTHPPPPAMITQNPGSTQASDWKIVCRLVLGRMKCQMIPLLLA
jgi:hypothetical protein